MQRRFIAALAQGVSITAAARLVGRSRQKAYALRARPNAASFAAAWDRALAVARLRQRPGPNRPVARPGTIAEGRLVWAQLARIERKLGGTFARPKVTKVTIPPKNFSQGDNQG